MCGAIPPCSLVGLDCTLCVLAYRFVGLFVSRKDRLREQGLEQKFTNVYVKNFGDDFADDQLQELFSSYGTIVSHVVMKDSHTGRGLGFGFVSFQDHDMAAGVSVTSPVCWYV